MRSIFLIFIIFFQSAVLYANDSDSKKISLKPENQQSFDNFIKVTRKIETNRFNAGKGDFKIPTPSLEQIVTDYKTDAAKADAIYKNRQIHIRGVSSNIQRNAFGEFYIDVKPDTNSKPFVELYISRHDPNFSRYKSGKAIDLVCYGTGAPIARPVFKNCVSTESYIYQKYLPIEKAIAFAIQDNYTPQSQKELLLITLYKTIEPSIQEDCKNSFTSCFNKVSSLLHNSINKLAEKKYGDLLEKHKDIPYLPNYQ